MQKHIKNQSTRTHHWNTLGYKTTTELLQRTERSRVLTLTAEILNCIRSAGSEVGQTVVELPVDKNIVVVVVLADSVAVVRVVRDVLVVPWLPVLFPVAPVPELARLSPGLVGAGLPKIRGSVRFMSGYAIFQGNPSLVLGKFNCRMLVRQLGF